MNKEGMPPKFNRPEVQSKERPEDSINPVCDNCGGLHKTSEHEGLLMEKGGENDTKQK